MEKYYTPELNEFYEGFEFEIKTVDTKEYIPSTFSMSNMSKDIKGNAQEHAVIYWLKHNQIRVKYLDKEGVDSLINENYDLKTIEFIEDNVYEFSFNKSGTQYQGFYTYSDRMISFYEDYRMMGNEKLDCIFRGGVNNKSELKKLMIQLGIK